MNKTAITLAYFILVGLGVVGTILILLIRPEALGSLVSTLTTVLGLATVAAVTFSGLGKVQTQIEQVRSQTNGTLSKKDDQIDALVAELRKRDQEAPSTVEDAPQSVGRHTAL